VSLLVGIAILAFAVFVGRSLVKRGGGGSDMIEVAALGKPCCFGPYTANFAEVVELMLQSGVARCVEDTASLHAVFQEWLQQPAQAKETGRKAQQLIGQQQAAQATRQYVEKLLTMLHAKKSAPS